MNNPRILGFSRFPLLRSTKHSTIPPPLLPLSSAFRKFGAPTCVVWRESAAVRRERCCLRFAHSLWYGGSRRLRDLQRNESTRSSRRGLDSHSEVWKTAIRAWYLDYLAGEERLVRRMLRPRKVYCVAVLRDVRGSRHAYLRKTNQIMKH